MKGRKNLHVALVLAALSLAACELRNSTRIDENLFLLRALEDTFARCPTAKTADSRQTGRWLARTRARVSAVRDSIPVRSLDPDIGSLYEDYLRLLDAYESYLVSHGLVFDAAGREAADFSLSVFAGLRTGSEAERRVLRRRENGNYVSWGDLDSVVLSIEEGAGSGQGPVPLGYGSGMEEAKATLREVWKQTRAHAEGVVRKLAVKYGWEPAEMGFGGSGQTFISSGWEQISRNPFAMIRSAIMRTQSDTPQDLLEKARMCVAAADLVPAGPTYDAFRADFLREAATLGVRATVMELEPFSYSAGPAPSASETVRLAELYLAADPGDPSGDGRMLLAHSLAAAGQYGDAIRAANEVRELWGGDPSFCYRYAKLMSLTYQLDLAADWLEQAYRGGFHDIDFVRADADLENLRAGLPKRFDQLTEVHWSFTIVWDRPLDDVIVKNESPFALTNVIIDLYVRQGRRTWEPVIRRDVLMPGETYTASDLMSVPGARHDEATGVLFCDQDP